MVISQGLWTVKGHSKQCSSHLLGTDLWTHMTVCLSLVHVELITVSVHSSSVAVWSCWILAGSGTQAHRSGASQTCSVAVMSVSVQAMNNCDVLSLQEQCRDTCSTKLCSIMLQHEVVGLARQQAWGSCRSVLNCCQCLTCKDTFNYDASALDLHQSNCLQCAVCYFQLLIY